MSKKIPLNHDLLVWARETAGYKHSDVALKMKKSVEAIVSWEKGESTPTYKQLEKLAYQIYKRPIAIFFFPEPPEEKTPKQEFRTLPEIQLDILPPRMIFLLKQARVMQENLQELNNHTNPCEKQILRDLHIPPKITFKNLATKVRQFLNIDIFTQLQWAETDVALKNWRNILENFGIFIFKESFAKESDNFSGFCLYDKSFPVIYLNNNKPKPRQVFTLFHELTHLLMKTSGIDTNLDDYLPYIKGESKKIEILCNKFAGEFLVPDDFFSKHIHELPSIPDKIEMIADSFNVSREVILRRLLDKKIVSQTYYKKKTADWAKQITKKKKSSGNYYSTKNTYLGNNYLELVFKNYYQKNISIEQTADYLGVKVRGVPEIESRLLRSMQTI